MQSLFPQIPEDVNLYPVTCHRRGLEGILRLPFYNFLKELKKRNAITPDGEWHEYPCLPNRRDIIKSKLVECNSRTSRLSPYKYRILHPEVVYFLLREYERFHRINQ